MKIFKSLFLILFVTLAGMSYGQTITITNNCGANIDVIIYDNGTTQNINGVTTTPTTYGINASLNILDQIDVAFSSSGCGEMFGVVTGFVPAIPANTYNNIWIPNCAGGNYFNSIFIAATYIGGAIHYDVHIN